MGRRGPPPTPTDILQARGSRLPAGRTQEPKPKGPIGTPPKRLSKDGKGVWRQAVKDLEEMHVGRRPDRHALERYCRGVVRSWGLAAFIDRHGHTYPIKNAEGAVVGFKEFKEVKILAELEANLLRLEQEFGLTPASRARLHVETEIKVATVSTRPRFSAVAMPIYAPESAR